MKLNNIDEKIKIVNGIKEFIKESCNFPVVSIDNTKVGIGNSEALNELNKNLSHACDVKEPIEAAIRWARMKNGQLVQGIMSIIKSLTASLGSDPTGLMNTAINVLKWIQNFLRWIQSVLQEVQDFMKTFTEYARIARAVIDYINSLPARLKAFLSECLSKVLRGIMSVISELFSTEGFSGGLDGFEDLSKEFSNTIGEIKNTAQEFKETVALPGQFIEALINPSTQADQSKAIALIEGSVKKLTDNGEAINNQTQFNKQSVALP